MLNFLPKKTLKKMDKYQLQFIYVIRLRKNKDVYINYKGELIKLIESNVTENEIEETFLKLCSYSVYAYSDSIKKGYITTDYGLRVGIAGEYVYENNEISCVKNISSLIIRIPHEVENSSQKLRFLFDKEDVSIFVISPPGLGKTTIIRDLTKFLSNKEKNLVVIDEKYEIYEKNNKFNLGGCTDVLSGIKKKDGLEIAIKNLKPDYVVLDEISSEVECDKVFNAIYCGINVVTTTHAKNYEEFKNKPLFKRFIKNKSFNYYIFLGEKIGEIKEIINKNGQYVSWNSQL